jgi:hypothetical protein
LRLAIRVTQIIKDQSLIVLEPEDGTAKQWWPQNQPVRG